MLRKMLHKNTFYSMLLAAAFIAPSVSHAVEAVFLVHPVDNGSSKTTSARPDDMSDMTALTKKLVSRYKDLPITEVSSTPMNGVYEVDIGHDIGYTDATGTYFIFGNLVDMPNKRNLTSERIASLSHIDFSKLPQSDSIKIVKGTGEHKFAVFSDPQCPYCKQFEKELDNSSLTDYTEYVYTFPIDSLHPGSSKIAKNIWCSKDKVGAWHNSLRDGVQPNDATCHNPVDRNIKLGTERGISGTPTFVNEKGDMVPGLMPMDGFSKFIGAH